ncbi:AraC family transcriptional regulator [Pedobacter sp. Hv1]|uniref:helix-turn-helix domain-containing protein n=1 Tax=Pedobacter sp. Hv1 TaxID=1740090 RepID=UPI0006D88B1F|nr:AraC family transcriptional regulator [Pedobacter sp. Hv1]KQC01461.1 hypothetical protein AQF98_07070 [Pedobacter sp. Hv1]
MKLFRTFKPLNYTIQKYISYYYLDICDEEDYFNEYICYPHVNTTISFYKESIIDKKENHNVLTYKENCPYLKIFTPTRESILKITQIGKVHKVAVVFKPLGINQFLAGKNIFDSLNPIIDDFLTKVFSTFDENQIANALDNFLLSQLSIFHNEHLEKALQIFHDIDNTNTIIKIAEQEVGITRKHLNHLFISYLNVTPQKYRMILRFRHLMNAKLLITNSKNLTQLAYYARYADQSHFIKACKQLTGLKPKQFFSSLKEVGSEDIFWTFTR